MIPSEGFMYNPCLNWGATEFAISRAIVELRAQHEYISARTIADHIGISRLSVVRALRKMIAAGLVSRGEGSIRLGGYRYEYHGTR